MKITKVIPLFLLASVGLSGCSLGGFFQPFNPSSEQGASDSGNVSNPISLPSEDTELSLSQFKGIIENLIEFEKKNLGEVRLDGIHNGSYAGSYICRYTERNGENFALIYQYMQNSDSYMLGAAMHYAPDYSSYDAITYNGSSYYVYSTDNKVEGTADPYIQLFGRGDYLFAPAAFIAYNGNLVSNTDYTTEVCDNIRMSNQNEITFRANGVFADKNAYANCTARIENGLITYLDIDCYHYDDPYTQLYRYTMTSEGGSRQRTPNEIYNAYIEYINGTTTSSSGDTSNDTSSAEQTTSAQGNMSYEDFQLCVYAAFPCENSLLNRVKIIGNNPDGSNVYVMEETIYNNNFVTATRTTYEGVVQNLFYHFTDDYLQLDVYNMENGVWNFAGGGSVDYNTPYVFVNAQFGAIASYIAYVGNVFTKDPNFPNSQCSDIELNNNYLTFTVNNYGGMTDYYLTCGVSIDQGTSAFEHAHFEFYHTSSSTPLSIIEITNYFGGRQNPPQDIVDAVANNNNN